MRVRKSWVALLAILLLFAACKGETPTAPPPGGDTPGGTTPPLNATLTVTASKTNPLINETVTITATVLVDGQPVPNGTAVQFVSNSTAGTFTDTTTTSTIRITTNGVATAALTSATTGTIRVTATVNNVSRFVDITFGTTPPCVPPDPACTTNDPTITSVDPTVGKPTGGEQIRITGTNFRGPIRVLFDLGDGQIKEGTVVSFTATEIVVITPAVNLGAGQQDTAEIIVLTEAGAATSDRIVAPTPFTFRNAQLTPIVYTITPNSGPINGGTLVTIVGEGFQSPVKVLFGAAEARIVSPVNFSQIVVEAPEARSTSPDGSVPTTGFVPVVVINVASNTRATSADSFRYITKMNITAIKPLVGSALGGTDVTIDGTGFDSPVFVTIGGVEARVLGVTGSQVLVRTGALPSACAGGGGVVIVRNVENDDFDIFGDQTDEQAFTYIGVQPVITGISDDNPPSGTILPGEGINVTVDDPGTGPLGVGTIRFTVVGRTIIPSPGQVTDPSAPQTFQFPLPLTGFVFPSVSCTTTVGSFPGTQFVSVDVPLTFRNENSACTATTTLTVDPPNGDCVRLPPIAAQTSPAPGTCANAGSVAVTDPATGQALITFRNNAIAGATELMVTASAPTGTNAGDFSISPPSESIPGQQTRTFTVTFNPSAAGVRNAAVVFSTNDPNNGTFTVCLQGTGTP